MTRKKGTGLLLLRLRERLRSILISTSVCMCLSVREISPEPYMRDIYQIFVDTAAYGRGSVLPRRR